MLCSSIEIELSLCEVKLTYTDYAGRLSLMESQENVIHVHMLNKNATLPKV
jgi:hypothetical protein